MTTVAIQHGTISGNKYHRCKCIPCSNANAEYQSRRYRRIGYGTWQPLVDAAPARDHIEKIHAQGMTWGQIADQAGILVEEIRRLRMPIAGKPRTERIRPERAEKLLAVTYTAAPAAPKSLVPSIGSTRRLHALRAIGWPLSNLAARSGISRHALAMVSRQDFVQNATREAVVELYDDLHDQDPRRHGVTRVAARRATDWATAQGWAAPNCWHGDIDHPDTRPGPPRGDRYSVPEMGARSLAIVEDTAELVRLGCSRTEIADRLGVGWESILQVHRRAGAPMPEVRS